MTKNEIIAQQIITLLTPQSIDDRQEIADIVNSVMCNQSYPLQAEQEALKKKPLHELGYSYYLKNTEKYMRMGKHEKISETALFYAANRNKNINQPVTILVLVASEYSIEVSKLIDSSISSKDPNLQMARYTAYCVFASCGLPTRSIAKIFGKDSHSGILLGIQHKKNLNPNSPSGRKFLEKYSSIISKCPEIRF
jgi:hypothetical protein